MTIYLNAVNASDYYLSAAILAVSCLTDMIDGKIARHFNMISTVGKVLDPFADKLTQFTLAVCLAVQYPIVWAMVILIFVKEIFQLIAGIVVFRRGRMLKGALIAGKVCTTVLFVSLIVMVLTPPQYLSNTVVSIVTAVDVVFLLISFVSYARAYYKHSPMIENLEDPKA